MRIRVKRIELLDAQECAILLIKHWKARGKAAARTQALNVDVLEAAELKWKIEHERLQELAQSSGASLSQLRQQLAEVQVKWSRAKVALEAASNALSVRQWEMPKGYHLGLAMDFLQRQPEQMQWHAEEKKEFKRYDVFRYLVFRCLPFSWTIRTPRCPIASCS